MAQPPKEVQMHQNVARAFDRDEPAHRIASAPVATTPDAAPVASPVHVLHDRLHNEIDLRRERAAFDSFSAKHHVSAPFRGRMRLTHPIMLLGSGSLIAGAVAALFYIG